MNSKKRWKLDRNRIADGGAPQQGHPDLMEWKNNLPRVTFWGANAAEEYVEKMTVILGPHCGVHTAESFCQSNGCTPDEMDTLLDRDYVLHNIQKVERGEEKTGLLPLILIQNHHNIFSISLYSPTSALRKECYPPMPNTNGLTQEDLRKLSQILGNPSQVFLVEEEEFCRTVECAPAQVEEHLREHWVEHDIWAVLAGLEFVPEPTVVLVSFRDGLVTWRLITQRDPEARQQCFEINELSKLYEWEPKKEESGPPIL